MSFGQSSCGSEQYPSSIKIPQMFRLFFKNQISSFAGHLSFLKMKDTSCETPHCYQEMQGIPKHLTSSACSSEGCLEKVKLKLLEKAARFHVAEKVSFFAVMTWKFTVPIRYAYLISVTLFSESWISIVFFMSEKSPAVIPTHQLLYPQKWEKQSRKLTQKYDYFNIAALLKFELVSSGSAQRKVSCISCIAIQS